jgi:hypothetical protein
VRRIVCVGLLLVGCEGPTSITADAMTPLDLSLDVIVTPEQLTVRTNSTDQICDCSEEMRHFASIGTCFTINDIIECRCDPPSCLTVNLTSNGVTLAQEISFPNIAYVFRPSFPPNLELELTGCGHASTTIPIEPFVAPIPTLTVDVATEELTARWQTDLPAASAYVSFSNYVWAQECHTTAQQASYSFAGYPAANYQSVGVTTFLPVLEHNSPRQDVRLWRGSGTHVNNPM